MVSCEDCYAMTRLILRRCHTTFLDKLIPRVRQEIDKLTCEGKGLFLITVVIAGDAVKYKLTLVVVAFQWSVVKIAMP